MKEVITTVCVIAVTVAVCAFLETVPAYLVGVFVGAALVIVTMGKSK